MNSMATAVVVCDSIACSNTVFLGGASKAEENQQKLRCCPLSKSVSLKKLTG